MKKTLEKIDWTLGIWDSLNFDQQWRTVILQSDIENRIVWLMRYHKTSKISRFINDIFADNALIEREVSEVHSILLSTTQFIQMEQYLDKEYEYFLENKRFSDELPSMRSLLESYIITLWRVDWDLWAKLLEKKFALDFFLYFLEQRDNMTALREARKHPQNLPLLESLWYGNMRKID